MSRRAGFSLTELMVTLVILGLLATFSIPGIVKSLAGWNLHSGRALIISEVKLLREKAISQGRSLRIWFSPGSNLYWFQNPTTGVWTNYQLPSRVTFASVGFVGSPTFYDTYLQPNGTSKYSGTLILQNTNGKRDTVIIYTSGWVGQP